MRMHSRRPLGLQRELVLLCLYNRYLPRPGACSALRIKKNSIFLQSIPSRFIVNYFIHWYQFLFFYSFEHEPFHSVPLCTCHTSFYFFLNRSTSVHSRWALIITIIIVIQLLWYSWKKWNKAMWCIVIASRECSVSLSNERIIDSLYHSFEFSRSTTIKMGNTCWTIDHRRRVRVYVCIYRALALCQRCHACIPRVPELCARM